MLAAVNASSAKRGTFTHVSERRYVMTVDAYDISFELCRVRRERGSLWGELHVRCKFSGARTIDGVLNAADFNLSSLQARVTRAKFLSERARTKSDEIDWIGLVEEFCQRTLTFAQAGLPGREFADIPEPNDDAATFSVMGLPLLVEHPVIWFGDGGTGKSLLALYAGLQLVQQGERVVYLDWELSEGAHRTRLGKLCAPDPIPRGFFYLRCCAPLVEDVERVIAFIADRKATYVICDSVAYAVIGAPETAEATNGYFGALRALNVGSLNLAHITKTGDEQDMKPFGSGFWHNGARSTWFLKQAEQGAAAGMIDVAFINRKENMGEKLKQPVGLRVEFSPTQTTIRAFDVSTHQELSARLPLWQRMRGELRTGPEETKTLAERLDCKESSIRSAVSRMDLFVRLPDGRVALSAGRNNGRDEVVPF